MGKIKFIVKRLAKFNFSNMIKTANKIAKKTHRLVIFVIIDIIYCGFKYQAGYNDYLEFEFYLLNSKQRETYLTAGINNSIIKKYNNKEYWHLLDDKIEFNNKFGKYLNRSWLDLRITTAQEFKKFIEKHNVIMVKPIDDCGGNGVEKIVIDETTNAEKIYNKLKENGQVLVEEFVIQHNLMDKLYSGSVNTLRMFTIHTHKGYYLQGILKFGNGGNVDNFSSGGMYTFVNEEGEVIAPAIDKNDKVYTEHPISKEKIVGFKVPLFEEAKELVCKAAEEVPEIAYIGWDVAITENGPVLIEGNCYPGVFQLRPSFSKDKTGVLPLYRKYMEIQN